MWRRQRRLWWTSGGGTPLTTPHWPSTARLWRESAALNSWGCTSRRISPGPPTPCHSPRRHNSAYTFFRRLKRASLPPPILTTFYRGTIESVLTSCITVWYGNCSAADRKTLQRTVNTAAKIIGAPLPSILDIFLARCSSKNQQHREGPHPPLPQSLPAPTIRKTVPEHQSPLRQTAQQLFPPGCESPELRSPHPPLKPHATPYLLKHGPHPPPPPPPNTPPPTLPHQRKYCEPFFVQFKCATHRWVGPYKPPVVTHSPLCTRHFSYIAICTQSHKRLIYVCLHAHVPLQIILYCSPASCLTHNVSLCTCTVFMWSIRIVCIVCIFYLYLSCIG